MQFYLEKPKLIQPITLQYNSSSILSNAFSNLNSPTIKSNSSITNDSATTVSSIASVESSSISLESATISDPYSLTFLTENQKHYNKLLDDLSIIDNIYDTFEYEPESSLYDKQVLDVARHIASKQQVLDTTLQSETNYVNDLHTFHEVFAIGLSSWLDGNTEKDVMVKFKTTSAKKDLDTLFHTIQELSLTHASFLSDLKDRLQLWGPTQLVSDVFNKLYVNLTVYEPFMRNHAAFVMVMDCLYKLPSFVKYLNQILEDNKNRHSTLKVNDFIYYVHTPLHRLNVYSKALKQLSHYSDPSHPDYSSLLYVSQKFKSLENEWSGKVKDCQSHLMVLEAYRTIKECPINITIYRRLLLSSQLIKVDLDDITLTSDIRMYFLYNDSLIYCKRQKEKKGNTERKLVYKGKLSLQGADIRQLAPSFCAKMVEVKKPLFNFGKKSSSSDSNSLPGAEAFGFELVTSEINMDAMSPLHQNYSSAMAGAGAPIRRRHVLRTKNQAEQALWYDTIRKAIKIANSLPA